MPDVTAAHRVRLVDRQEVAEGTLAFSVEKPAGFSHVAGQAADVTLLAPAETDDEGSVRTFSIASPPSEGVLTFATRLRDTAFKRVLRRAAPGTELLVDGPFGSFTLHKNVSKPAVFLAGGIGITPFRSIILDAADRGDQRPLHLFYSNRRPEDAAFLGELEVLPQRLPSFHLVATMAEMEKSSRAWGGERGFIDAGMLRRHLPSVAGPIYYVAGPPGMVAAMRQVLVTAGVDEDDIRTEDFAGY